MPKVGEYWNLSIPLRGTDGIEMHSIVAKCVSIRDGYPVFYGNAPTHYRKVYYGPGFYNCKWISKWEPNWFWKLLGYK
jgi:hypothetical protein